MMEQILQALFLGLIQGVTELLPISSSAHVLLAEKMLSFSAIEGKAFAALIQVGSAFALLCRFFPKVRSLTVGICRGEKTSLSTLGVFTLALIPVVIVGFFFHSYIREHFYSNTSLALSLMIGGALFIILDPISHTLRKETISYKEASIIGLFQIFSFIPGASRLGSNLVGGTMAGLARKPLLTFSFLLAIPVLLGACMNDVVRIHESLTLSTTLVLGMGFLASFAGTYFFFPIMFKFLLNKGLFFMGWYRIFLGTVFYCMN